MLRTGRLILLSLKDDLSYSWALWNDGNYKDTYGNEIYLTIWISIGFPYWWGLGGSHGTMVSTAKAMAKA